MKSLVNQFMIFSFVIGISFVFLEFLGFLLSNIFYLQTSFVSLVKNCNHKGLGIYYLLSAFIFGISGTLISVLIRIELYSSGNRIISPENQNFYNISITLHGFLMLFFLVMPGLFGGFGNYFIVIFQGSPEVVYPRVNNFSILILSLSYLFLILSLISEFGGGTGWTLYPPLSTSFMSLSPSSTGNLIFGLLISGISSCLTSLNFWTTILILFHNLLQTLFGISSFSHPDNALEVCGLLTPLHIVPEWYFLCQYHMKDYFIYNLYLLAGIMLGLHSIIHSGLADNQDRQKDKEDSGLNACPTCLSIPKCIFYSLGIQIIITAAMLRNKV